MATNSLDKPTVFSIAGDLDNVRDYLRISQDMMMDLLCDCSMNDLEGLKKMHERIYFLVNQMPAKLDEMEQLTEQLQHASSLEPA